MDPEDRPKFVPQAFTSLRHVPMYSSFIKEIFERCLDLYLCPRVRKKRMHIDPESLVPQLPKPKDLQPFPITLALRYLGHKSKVRSIAPDPSGQWLVSGSDDCSMRLWEVRSGRCVRTWDLGGPVQCVAWCPMPGPRLLSACVGSKLIMVHAGLGGAEEAQAAMEALKVQTQ
jgi:ribosome biogenesis protein ERB1